MDLSCPQCTAIWGMDEVERGHCFACGWPEDDDHENEDEWEYDNEEYYTCGCQYCYCGSHVSVPFSVCNDCLSGAHQG